MFFDTLFEFLAYYLGALLVVALVGMHFAKKHKELNADLSAVLDTSANAKTSVQSSQSAQLNTNAEFGKKALRKKSALSGLYKHCPCRKAVENGVMSSICVYSGVAGFMLSLTNIALVGIYSVANFAVLALSMICAYFGWVLKK